MQAARRLIVGALLSNTGVKKEWEVILQDTYKTLTDSRTQGFQREVQTFRSKLMLNIKDEITGLAVSSCSFLIVKICLIFVIDYWHGTMGERC